MHGGPDHCRPPVVWRRVVKERSPPSERRRVADESCGRTRTLERAAATRTPDGRGAVRITSASFDPPNYVNCSRRLDASPRGRANHEGCAGRTLLVTVRLLLESMSHPDAGAGAIPPPASHPEPRNDEGRLGLPRAAFRTRDSREKRRLGKALHLEPAIAGADVHRNEMTPAPPARWERMNARGPGCFEQLGLRLPSRDGQHGRGPRVFWTAERGRGFIVYDLLFLRSSVQSIFLARPSRGHSREHNADIRPYGVNLNE
jgi:hypothetical protein